MIADAPSALQLDALREVANVGCAHAATALSKLVEEADSDDAAWNLAAPYLLGKIRMRTVRRFDAFPSRETADAYAYSTEERHALDDFAKPQLIGSGRTVRAKLADLVERTGADEIMALTLVPDQEDRARSFALFAEAASAVRPGNAEGVSALL